MLGSVSYDRQNSFRWHAKWLKTCLFGLCLKQLMCKNFSLAPVVFWAKRSQRPLWRNKHLRDQLWFVYITDWHLGSLTTVSFYLLLLTSLWTCLCHHRDTNSNKHHICHPQQTSCLQQTTSLCLLFTATLTEVVYIWCIQLLISNIFLNLLAFSVCSYNSWETSLILVSN